jgi:polyisoprenoid-binding protein YceI
MHRSARTFLSAFALVMALPALAADTYAIDAVHSTVGFKIKHLTVSNVTGRFAKFDGTINLDSADITKSTVSVSIPVESVDTINGDRDKHLKSADFFDVAKYPVITFTSTSVSGTKDQLMVTGNFTMHGITKQVVIKGEFSGPSAGMKPGTWVAGFSGSTTLKRSDFGVGSYPAAVLGELVTINLEVEAHK